MMKLKKLLKTLPVKVKGSLDIEITGICSDSKCIFPGNLFIAKRGLTEDGSKFIPEAVDSGAVAILTDIYDPFLQKVTQIIAQDVAALQSQLACEFYGYPSDDLFLVGVTGSSGKTTIAYLVKHLMDHVKKKCGLIGSIEWIVGDAILPSTLTTPDICTNAKLLREMITKGCKACVMEVSSHALKQNRVELLEFDVAIFTNLSQEHLDYHPSMEDYRDTKAKLFTSLGTFDRGHKHFPKLAIVNNDSPYSSRMKRDTKAQILTYGIDTESDVSATILQMSTQGSIFEVRAEGMKALFETPLLGKFNISNLLSGISVGLSIGIGLAELSTIFRSFTGARGRLEKLELDKPYSVFIDHSHKPDALENVLLTLRGITQGKLITVFGCGGNRDRQKRPLMGRIAERLSDKVIITSDNPRQEDPEQIIEEILGGMENQSHAFFHVDRKEAIRSAVQMAESGDVILIAGKGHETTQIHKTKIIPFDDRVEAGKIIKEFS